MTIFLTTNQIHGDLALELGFVGRIYPGKVIRLTGLTHDLEHCTVLFVHLPVHKCVLASEPRLAIVFHDTTALLLHVHTDQVKK